MLREVSVRRDTGHERRTESLLPVGCFTDRNQIEKFFDDEELAS
jgi:hypothetical protein